jgi:transcriptional regulator with XRE-family HTH domain
MVKQIASNGGERKAIKHRPDQLDVHVGRRLRARRLILGVTQEELAEHLGLTFQQIQKYENGTNRISASRLYLLAKVFDCAMDYFFEDLPAPRTKRASRVAMGEAAVAELMASAEGFALCRAFVGIKTPAQRKAAIAFLRTAGGDPD